MKSKKLFPLYLILFLLGNSLNSQNSLSNVSVAPFTYDVSTSAVSSEKADQIGRMVAQYIGETGRLQAVNREQWEALMEERELQMRSDFIDGYIVEQGAAIGADVLIFGHVVELDTENLGYSTIQLVATDVATGQQIASEVLSTGGRKPQDAAYVDEILKANTSTISGKGEHSNLLTGIIDIGLDIILKKSMQKNVQDYIIDHFPLRLGIEAYEKETEDEVLEVLIAGGEQFGLKKGQKLSVKCDIPMGGDRTRIKDIAELKIQKIEGDFAVCKVTKGKSELYASKQEAIYVTN